MMRWLTFAAALLATGAAATAQSRPAEVNPLAHPAIETEVVPGLLTAPILTVLSRMEGVIQKVAVAEGDRVHKDQFLVQLDDHRLRLAAEDLETHVASARAEHGQDQQLYNRAIIAEHELAQSGASLRAAEIALELARQDIADAAVKSPTAGVVVEVPVRAGQFVAKGDELTRIVDTDHLKAEASVPEQRYARLRPGQKIEFIVPAYPGQRFTGQIDFISPIIDPDTHTVLVKAKIDNADDRLKPGMAAQVKLFLPR